ncbi:tRNA1(Val) (adenine(37)-N6)-methyltransferase [Sulfurospirillum sp. 1612]|uniref:tRNA1(Val) (adenine(37)-N6)-methyltransferase n=1 Tax=Sulfurospirillum sp. 1612 TaxID=3094835 RepID=UPI002F934E7D
MLKLYQYKQGYRYNSDTIFLYNFITQFDLKGSVLDVGCGCGVLGLLLKRDFNKIALTQIDIQERNIALTQRNAEANKLKTLTLHDDFLTHDFSEKFDCIISNPPFYNRGALKSEDPSLYLSRHSDALDFERFAIKAYRLLKHRGSFLFCYDAKQIDLLMSKLVAAKFKINHLQFVHVRANKEAGLVMVHARRDSKSLCKTLPPIILYEGDSLRDEIKNFYIKADTDSEDI